MKRDSMMTCGICGYIDVYELKISFKEGKRQVTNIVRCRKCGEEINPNKLKSRPEQRTLNEVKNE